MRVSLYYCSTIACLLMAGLQGASAGEGPAPKKVAIVIGVTTYDESVLKKFEAKPEDLQLKAQPGQPGRGIRRHLVIRRNPRISGRRTFRRRQA